MESKELIPNLPHDAGLHCLLRLSLNSHLSLKSVCRDWYSLLNNPAFYQERRRQGRTEFFVCLIQSLPHDSQLTPTRKHVAYSFTVYDPKFNTWERLPLLPDFSTDLPVFCQCVAVQNSLVLLGGWNPVTWEAMKCVYIFEFITGKWRRGSDMLVVRSFFACGVMGSLVLVAGGHDDNKNALRAAEVYNMELDEWRALPNMWQERDECKGAVVDSKYYVISGYTTDSQGQFLKSADVFDACTGRWELVEDMWPTASCPPFILSFRGELLSINRQDLVHYNLKRKVWDVIDRVPEVVRMAPCASVMRGETIFVSGTKGHGVHTAFVYKPACRLDGPGKWIPIHIRDELFNGMVRDACTIEI